MVLLSESSSQKFVSYVLGVVCNDIIVLEMGFQVLS